jgi:alpha-D-ribose 1-methylphosphonate 5-triphosphate synthase subunit PhnG
LLDGVANIGRRTSESDKATVTGNSVTDQSADYSTTHSNTDNSSSSSSIEDSLQQQSDTTDTTAISDSLQSASQQQQQQQQEMVMATPSDPAADNLFRVFLVFGEMRSNGVKPDNAGIHIVQ